ncbi:type IV secretory pathway TraG/TraD family ATPase VirD4 [Bradyrhizobium diazoefficiens]
MGEMLKGLFALPMYAIRFTVAIIGVLWMIAKWLYRLFKGRKSLTTHGDADWAVAKQLKAKGHFTPQGWLCAVFNRKRVFTDKDASLLLVAPKGQGKTQTVIATVREQASRKVQPDLVICDPAGDIEPGTRETLKQNGYSIIRIDLVNPPSGQAYDVLNILRPSYQFDFDRDVDQLCQLILPDDAHTREAHFQEFSRILLAGAISHLLKTPPGDATLHTVVEKLTTDAKARRVMFEQMGKHGDNLVKQAINAFEEAGDRERGSFSTTMTRKLKVWLRQSVKHVTETGKVLSSGAIDRGWTWEEVYEADFPVAVFIKTGLGTDEGAVARLILGNAINTRRRMHNHLAGQGVQFPKPLRLIVDEARTIGNCNALLDANNELRKAGVSTMLCYLSFKDIRDIFPQADTLIAGSNIVIFGGSNEITFYEEMSRILGDKTIESGSKSESAHGQSKGANEQARRLMKADELRRLSYEECVVILGNLALRANKPFSLGKKGVVYH